MDWFELRLEDRRVFVLPKQHEYWDRDLCCWIVLVVEMVVGAQGDQVHGVVIVTVLVYMVDLRTITATYCATMVVFLQYSLLN